MFLGGLNVGGFNTRRDCAPALVEADLERGRHHLTFLETETPIICILTHARNQGVL